MRARKAACTTFVLTAMMAVPVPPAEAQQAIDATAGVVPRHHADVAFQPMPTCAPADDCAGANRTLALRGGSPAIRARDGSGLGDAERRRWAPVVSLLMPGAGQALLHQDRFIVYVALEAWGALEFANQRTEARRQQSRYRGLAADVARSLYGSPFPVGTWGYYESMEHYLESGVFDRVPGGDVDPDIDASTYNGAMWLLARTTYWADPSVTPSAASLEYRRALNFYLDRAVKPEYRWSWRNAQLSQDLYVRTIRRANNAFRGARAALGAVIANHLLSSVDAFVTLRVEGLDGGDGRGFALRGSLPFR